MDWCEPLKCSQTGSLCDLTVPLFSAAVWSCRDCEALAPCRARTPLTVRLCPPRLRSRHVHRGEPSGASPVRGCLVSAEQRPQAGTPAPLDDLGPDLVARRCVRVHARQFEEQQTHSDPPTDGRGLPRLLLVSLQLLPVRRGHFQS